MLSLLQSGLHYLGRQFISIVTRPRVVNPELLQANSTRNTYYILENDRLSHQLLLKNLLQKQGISFIEQQLHNANSIEWMQTQAKQGTTFQVVYLDPMFPHNDKSALVKKEMRAFRPVVGDDLDADQLLDAALAIAENRVVVKRPRKAPFLADRKPSLQFQGKSSRYDIYPLKKLEA